jgi:hypothetical protein
MTWRLPVAAVSAAEPADEESGQVGEPVAAVTPFHKKKQQSQHTSRCGNAAAPAAVTAKAEMLASGLCRFHWKYGEDARLCAKPCSWQRNQCAKGGSTPSPLAASCTSWTNLHRGVSSWTQEPPTLFFISLHLASSPALASRVQMDCIFLAGESADYPWFSTAAVSSSRFC